MALGSEILKTACVVGKMSRSSIIRKPRSLSRYQCFSAGGKFHYLAITSRHWPLLCLYYGPCVWFAFWSYRAAYITLQLCWRSAVRQPTVCLVDAFVFMKSRNCYIHFVLFRSEGPQKRKVHAIETYCPIKCGDCTVTGISILVLYQWSRSIVMAGN